MKRVDERDIIFSRVNYKYESSAYNDYYFKNPNKKDIDDSLRNRPDLCEEGTMTYNEINSKIAISSFEFLNDISHLCYKKPKNDIVSTNPKVITKRIKGILKHYGACIVGVTNLKDYHIYTHRGRHEVNYGEKIDLNHKYAIVFACEMDKDMINRAPMISEVIETSKSYLDVAICGMVLTYFINSLGYDCRNHIDSNYLVIPSYIAKDAGLGEIGRNAILTNKDYGSRLKLGVVTTSLELECDSPISFGLEDFCNECKKCSHNCPSKSLSNTDKIDVYGNYKWIVNSESCYTKWRYLGTDCGMCISCCPFSQNLETIKNTETFKDNKKLILLALDEFNKKFKNRVFIPGHPDWLR